MLAAASTATSDQHFDRGVEDRPMLQRQGIHSDIGPFEQAGRLADDADKMNGYRLILDVRSAAIDQKVTLLRPFDQAMCRQID